MHKYEKKRSFNAQTTPLSEVRVRGNPAMLVALNITRGVFGRLMRVGMCGGEINRAMPLALMIAANNFPTHHMLAGFSYYTTWHNIMLSGSTCRSIGAIAANTF